MPDFTQSWALWFIIGCFVGGCFGFLGAAILAASGKASRMEERMGNELMRKAVGAVFNCPNCGRVWDSRTHDACQCGAIIQEPDIEIVTQNNPRTD